ncbi:MAG: HAD-IA family hydrolase [Prevotellaceae bacterium]|jgi:HAD superfamily hydrolase (TIGR01509 family)|nr:HAD-IA family hydrolase [Prevotellaceae bacterium]
MYQEVIARYLQSHGYTFFSLSAVLFDMDGVLFNSMPYHAQAWHLVMERHGLHLSDEEAYLHEGRTGADTINILYNRQFGKKAPQKLIQKIYAEKTAEFHTHPDPEAMPGAALLLRQIKDDKLIRMVVTGSGQKSLLKRLSTAYPRMFNRELMVTAFDVHRGKPHPEPYLKALEKAGLQPNEAIVVENAPLGVRAAVAAGIFTIAVNTGPIDPQLLMDEGANMVFPSMKSLSESWLDLHTAFGEHQIIT